MADFTESLDYGDEVMAGRCFNVTEELAVLDVKLMVSAYTKGTDQLSRVEELDAYEEIPHTKQHCVLLYEGLFR